MKKAVQYILCPFILVLLAFGVVWSWGFDAHRFINREATKHLPSDLTLFIDNASFLSEHSVDADLRKGSDPNEGPRHYIDIDEYPEFFSGTLPHDIDSLIAKYGEATVYSIGVVPWASVSTFDTLVAALGRQDWNRALLAAADLGHYVGDAHQPLHVTKNYDGQYTGNQGIHSRYETTMLNTYLSSVVIRPSRAVYVESPIDFVFEYIERSYTRIDTILQADNVAKAASGGQYNSTYYQALWQQTGEMTSRILQEATENYAHLLYTAAVDAGILSPTSVAHVSLDPEELTLYQNYPNPFNPQTFISYSLPHAAKVRLNVFDLLGREVDVLVDERQASGMYTVKFDASGLTSGVYFYRLTAANYVHTRKFIVVK